MDELKDKRSEIPRGEKKEGCSDGRFNEYVIPRAHREANLK